MTLAPTPILHDQASLLADVRVLLSQWPILADRPERVAARLQADEHAIRTVLEALEIEGELLP
jgi:hypothetical protein